MSWRSVRLRMRLARSYACRGLPLSAAGSTCAWTCHDTPSGAPGTAAAAALGGGAEARRGATFAANVLNGTIAMSAGGWAAAGPTSGFNGWKSTSAAVTTATPDTGRRTGCWPRRTVIATRSPICAWSVAASCWSSTTAPSRSPPRSIRIVWKWAR